VVSGFDYLPHRLPRLFTFWLPKISEFILNQGLEMVYSRAGERVGKKYEN
jgi:hypothetical protein